LSCYRLSSHDSQQTREVSSILIIARMDTSNNGLSHTFKGTGVAANGLTHIKYAVDEDSSFSIEAEYT